jgi:hypothetical protein
MIIQKKAKITVELINKNKEIPAEKEEDFKEWLMHKAALLGQGWHHEYYAVDDDVYHDIYVKILVTITLIDS